MSEQTTSEVDDALQQTQEDVVVEAALVQETDPVAALTADLQRLQAEYANYRKRVERDRALAHE
jgi:molecular chaperone GrpE